MRAGSFGKLTHDKENTTQVTFHYVEGHAETFTIRFLHLNSKRKC